MRLHPAIQRMLLALSGVALTAAMAACTAPPADTTTAPVAPASTPTAASPPELPLQARLVGDCNTPGGYRLDSSGFTPNGQHQTSANFPPTPDFPDGRPYINLEQGGIGSNDANGTTPEWSWDCRVGPDSTSEQLVPDPPGVYRVTIRDLATNGTVSFDLSVPPGLPVIDR